MGVEQNLILGGDALSVTEKPQYVASDNNFLFRLDFNFFDNGCRKMLIATWTGHERQFPAILDFVYDSVRSITRVIKISGDKSDITSLNKSNTVLWRRTFLRHFKDNRATC